MDLSRLTLHNAAWRADWAYQFLSRGQLPKLKAPFWFETELGAFHCPDPYGPMQFRKGWESETVKEVSKLRDGFFVDVGANIGFYTILAAKNGNQVLAIEPNPKVFDSLVKTVNANMVRDRVILLNAAIWNEDGALHMETTDDYCLGHVYGRLWNLDGRKPEPTFPVPCFKLDSVVKSRPSLVKLDIEGSEPEALEGSTTIIRDRPRIIFEAIDTNHYDRCRKYLNGYSIEWLGGVNYLAS